MHRAPTNYLKIIGSILAACLIIAAVIIGVHSITIPVDAAIAPSTQIAEQPTAAATPTMQPTAQPTPTTVPTPSITVDPEGIFYKSTGTEVLIQDDIGFWRYKDANLNVTVEKVYRADCSSVFFIADIRVRNTEYPAKMGFMNAQNNKPDQRGYPWEIARKFNAVIAINADFFVDGENKANGPVLRGGTVFKSVIGNDVMALMPDGELKVFHKEDGMTPDDLLEMGVKDTVAFGPILVENGEMNTDITKHKLHGINPRSAIGMIEPGHYIIICVDGRKPGVSKGVTLTRLAQEFMDFGCTVAYNLDGGQSTGIVFMGNQLNDHEGESKFNGQRRVPEMLYIGTSDQVPYSED